MAVWKEKVREAFPDSGMAAPFRVLANERHRHFLLTLIRESNLDDELFPLVVAMDYLETGDRTPLENYPRKSGQLPKRSWLSFRRVSTPPGRSMDTTHA
jgi:hypothetical protein